MEKMKVVIVTGLSGAGKTNAADWFEDQGYYCVDNMPPALISHFLELTAYSNRRSASPPLSSMCGAGNFSTI